ncbi:hypothetical protein BDV12DRAFT_205896 [Aspergillus spectabilis]
MPRPRVDLEPYWTEITNLYQTGTHPDTLSEFLDSQYGVKGIQKQNRTASADKILHARIRVLFYQVGLEEKEMLRVLQYEGFEIEAAQVEEVFAHLRTELSKGQIEGYGRRLLYQHIQSQGYLLARDRLYSLYRELAPAAVRRCLNDLQCHRGAYIVPGPNFIWLIDGYLKLAPYGIEVYAAIDAYSRYIIWIYIGISSRTAITEQLPRFVRSDQGTETVLLAEAQHKLQQSQHPEIRISECYLYGTSTANQRIEAWWLQLTRGLLYRWRNYFQSLQDEGLYSADTLHDQIALYAIYMPVLRIEITSFVRLWNNHSIRKQPNRPYLVSGKPYINYNRPEAGIHNHGIQFDWDLFKKLHRDVQDWDADEYLPADTYNWTSVQLQELGFDPQNPPDNAGGDIYMPFRMIYLELRARIQAHISGGSEPELGLSSRPTGAFDWEPISKQAGIPEIPEIEVEYDREEDKYSGDTR